MLQRQSQPLQFFQRQRRGPALLTHQVDRELDGSWGRTYRINSWYIGAIKPLAAPQPKFRPVRLSNGYTLGRWQTDAIADQVLGPLLRHATALFEHRVEQGNELGRQG